ncbi:unnamed protein product, partial [Urochloa humidicola]
ERHPELQGPDAATPYRFASGGVRDQDDSAAAALPSAFVPAPSPLHLRPGAAAP